MIRTLTEKLYFEWLCDLSGIDLEGRESYSKLALQLYESPFYSVIMRDINRAKDGERLRLEYAEEHNLDAAGYSELAEQPCSYLEMLVALSMRMSELTVDGEDDGYSVKKFFWEILGNVGLDGLSDSKWVWDESSEMVNMTLNAISNRWYLTNGKGGLFPLKVPKCDQTEVEIWYQMNAYIMENYDVFA